MEPPVHRRQIAPSRLRLEELFEFAFEVFRRDRAFGGVRHGLFAKMVKREGPGRGEAAAPGLLHDEPHEFEGYLGLALRVVPLLLHGMDYKGETGAMVDFPLLC